MIVESIEVVGRMIVTIDSVKIVDLSAYTLEVFEKDPKTIIIVYL